MRIGGVGHKVLLGGGFRRTLALGLRASMLSLCCWSGIGSAGPRAGVHAVPRAAGVSARPPALWWDRQPLGHRLRCAQSSGFRCESAVSVAAVAAGAEWGGGWVGGAPPGFGA